MKHLGLFRALTLLATAPRLEGTLFSIQCLPPLLLVLAAQRASDTTFILIKCSCGGIYREPCPFHSCPFESFPSGFGQIWLWIQRPDWLFLSDILLFQIEVILINLFDDFLQRLYFASSIWHTDRWRGGLSLDVFDEYCIHIDCYGMDDQREIIFIESHMLFHKRFSSLTYINAVESLLYAQYMSHFWSVV